ncbi:hypothetical protein SLA2020_133650 [Shorea laevis]
MLRTFCMTKCSELLEGSVIPLYSSSLQCVIYRERLLFSSNNSGGEARPVVLICTFRLSGIWLFSSSEFRNLEFVFIRMIGVGKIS